MTDETTAQEAYEAGRRFAHKMMTGGVYAADALMAAEVMAAWLSPVQFDETVTESGALIVVVGRPERNSEGFYRLHATVGKFPLTDIQSVVGGVLRTAGAGATFADIPVDLHADAVEMLNAGVLYAFDIDGGNLYGGDRVPTRTKMLSVDWANVGRGERLNSLKLRNEAGDEAEMSVYAFSAAPLMDGSRDLDRVVSESVVSFLQDPGQQAGMAEVTARVKAAALLELNLTDAQKAEISRLTDEEMVAAYFRNGIIEAVQAGWFWLDIQQ